MNILHVNSSINGTAGQSSQLAERFVTQLRKGGARAAVRDLASNPIPHLDAARFGAFVTKPDERTAEQQAVTDFSDALIDELRDADVLVLAVPMYNFGIPSQLKAYFDHVARAGVTFKYTEKGPVGLLSGKQAYVFATRGGYYAGTERDSQTTYVRDFLAFIGIKDVEFIYAEGLNVGEVQRKRALDMAHGAIEEAIGDLMTSLELAA